MKEVRQRFRTEFRLRPLSSPAILRRVTYFEEDGNVRDKERTRLSPSQQVFWKNAILDAYAADPHLSTQRRARLFDVPRCYVHGVLKNSSFAYK